MSTQITTVPTPTPTGFKYNISVYSGTGPLPAAASGQAIILFLDDGTGSITFEGLSISSTDANGLNAASFILPDLNNQPLTLFINSSSYTTFNNIASVTVVGGAYFVTSNDHKGTDPNTLNGKVGYFEFGTSQSVPTYNGYSMAGNLNGTAINAGTVYLGIGSATSNATETNRSVPVAVSQGNISNAYLRTAGVMTGSMELTIMITGVAVGTPYTIPTGSAAGSYPFLNYAGLSNGNTVSIRVIQSTATSSGVLTYGWVIK